MTPRRLDKAVDDGLLTEEHASTMLERLRLHIGAIVSGEFPRRHGQRHRHGPPAFPRL
jgi:hypothetical protein